MSILLVIIQNTSEVIRKLYFAIHVRIFVIRNECVFQTFVYFIIYTDH